MRGLIRFVIIFIALWNRLLFWRIKKSQSPNRILIAHNLLLGDTLLLAPLMKRIHEKYPNSEKYILVKSLFLPLFKLQPYNFKALPYDQKNFLFIWNIFRCGPYDLTFVAGDNRYSWLSRALRSKWTVGIANDRPIWKNWMIDEAISFDPMPTAWADMMAKLVDGKNPNIYQKNEWVVPERKNISDIGFITSPYVICHLGASTSLKLWPKVSWQKLIDILIKNDFKVLLSAGPGEEYLAHEVDPKQKLMHIAGKTSLEDMWGLIKNAKLLISVDTGIAHIAKLTHTPLVTLFGPGSPVCHGAGSFWNNSPHCDVTKNDFICRDQNILFRREINWLKRCGRNKQECKTPGACMDIITPSQVISSINKSFNL